MIPVSRIYNRARNIVTSCSDAELFEHLTDAVEMLANKGDFDPLFGTVDISAQGKYVTLPRDVETVLAVNISGQPSMARDRLFNFHINGPGDRDNLRSCRWRWWKDGGQAYTFRDLQTPSRLAAAVDVESDEGSDLWVEGVSPSGVEIRTLVGGTMVTGYKVPTVFGSVTVDANSPVFGRITRVRTGLRNGAARLYASAVSTSVLSIIGLYQWDEIEPQLRRIELDEEACWVRLFFRRRIFEIRHVTDLIPLHSALAVLEALRAVRSLSEDDVVTAAQHEAMAVRYVTERESVTRPTIATPVQIDPRNLLFDRSDYID